MCSCQIKLDESRGCGKYVIEFKPERDDRLSVHKDTKRGTWYVKIKYTDWTGEKKETTRRGFAKKKDAQLFEQDFHRQKQCAPSMSFQALYDLYMADMKPRLRPTTYHVKERIFVSKILPSFAKLPCDQITPAKIRQWQNKIVSDNYSETYLRAINNQLTAIFNFAMSYYGLPSNPMKRAGLIGKSHAGTMKFWTVDDFQKFIRHTTNPLYKTSFSILFWTGMRIGELLALTYKDFDFDKNIIHITKTYTRLFQKDIIGPPKTPKSTRDVTMPLFLAETVKVYIQSLHAFDPSTRLFEITKYGLSKEMKRGSFRSGVKEIRLHDLRHSHASYLIHRGIPIIAISQRLGHEKIETTLRTYAHLYPQDRDIIIDAIESDPEIKGSIKGHKQ